MSDHASKLATARAQLQTGRPDQAKATLLRALQKPGAGPAAAPMALLLSQILLQTGAPDQALHYAQRALAASPSGPAGTDARLHLANVLWTLARPAEALAAARDAVNSAPARRDVHATLVNFLLREERFADALGAADAALERFAGDAEFLAVRASMLLSIGRPEQAVRDMRDALRTDPANLRLLGALAPALNYVPDVPAAELLDAHRAYAKALLAALPPRPSAAAAPRTPGTPTRPLRLGILSPDLRAHAMWHFIHPILAHLDRQSFEVFCYFTGGNADDSTESLRAAGPATWRHVPTLNVAQLADQIRADAIDILVDFAGHTRFNRLATMALRPAPLQLNFTGYPCTTGLPQIDYHVTDSICSPPAEPDATLFVERLLRVDPIFFCYQPSPNPPEVALPPSDATGCVTFGSFNTLMKLNDRVVQTWARVVNSVPGSRLLVKNIQLRQEQARTLTRDRFLAAGVSAERLEVIGHEGTPRDHLATYARVDIALDTFPYAGMTTTCESLLMGVPVVTLAQHTFASRVGRSILENAGLPELVAGTEDAFVAAAGALAADAPRRRALRGELRGRFLGTPVCDGPGYAARFGAALLGAWAVA
jgi:protein O-GlcNAc transferase